MATSYTDGAKHHQTSTLYIGYIGVGRANRRKGRGTRLMEALVRVADICGRDMDGIIDQQKEEGSVKPPMTARQLLRPYPKFGFELAPKYVSLIERKHKMGCHPVGMTTRQRMRSSVENF